MSIIQRYRTDFERLIELGKEMRADFDPNPPRQNREVGKLENNYQQWYTECRAVIKQLLPDRLDEFDQLYKGDGRRKATDFTSYTIQDWLVGNRARQDARGVREFNDGAVIYMRFQTQLAIFASAETRIDSILFDIKQVTQADLFDSELDAARELLRNGFLRAAGVVAGVVLERHLRQVMENHNVSIRKNPTISSFNDCLKDGGVLDIPSWRAIQRLADIRNYCGHDKEREPTKDEVEELISGVEKYTKTLF